MYSPSSKLHKNIVTTSVTNSSGKHGEKIWKVCYLIPIPIPMSNSEVCNLFELSVQSWGHFSRKIQGEGNAGPQA